MSDHPQGYVHEIRALGDPVPSPMLSDADQAEVNRYCAELQRHRDQAAASGGGYLVGGSRG